MILKYANEPHGLMLATSVPKPGRLNEPVGDSYQKRRTDSDGGNLIPLGMESNSVGRGIAHSFENRAGYVPTIRRRFAFP